MKSFMQMCFVFALVLFLAGAVRAQSTGGGFQGPDRITALETRVGSIEAKVDSLGQKMDTIISLLDAQRVPLAPPKSMVVVQQSPPPPAMQMMSAPAFQMQMGSACAGGSCGSSRMRLVFRNR